MPKYDYKIVATKDALHPSLEEHLRSLGGEGWELISITGSEALLKKELSSPVGIAKACANCRNFNPTEKAADASVVTGWCNEWKLAMEATGKCDEKFVQKDNTVQAVQLPTSVGHVPDQESAWHWQPRTELGEKRVEAVTNVVAGASSPEHRHRVLFIMAKDGSVVRGKTDMINGHEHNIKFLGMTEEAEGHTHQFDMPRS